MKDVRVSPQSTRPATSVDRYHLKIEGAAHSSQPMGALIGAPLTPNKAPTRQYARVVASQNTRRSFTTRISRFQGWDAQILGL